MGEVSLIFWTYGLAARYILGRNPKSEFSVGQVALSGLFSGLAAGTYLTPVEYIKCRLQAESTPRVYTSAFDC